MTWLVAQSQAPGQMRLATVRGQRHTRSRCSDRRHATATARLNALRPRHRAERPPGDPECVGASRRSSALLLASLRFVSSPARITEVRPCTPLPRTVSTTNGFRILFRPWPADAGHARSPAWYRLGAGKFHTCSSSTSRVNTWRAACAPMRPTGRIPACQRRRALHRCE